jgi:aminotransferase
VGGLQALGFRCHVPQGAYYVMADVGGILEAKGLKDESALARRLVEDVKVAAVPGGSFYKALTPAAGRKGKGEPKLRFCFCKQEETLSLALERLTDYCRI